MNACSIARNLTPFCCASVALLLACSGAPQAPNNCPVVNYDCGTAGYKTDADGCVTGCKAYTPCTKDADCTAPQTCDTKDYCDQPANCADGGACATTCTGRCVSPPAATCHSDADCTAPDVCSGGKCVSAPPPNQCAGAALDNRGNCVGPSGFLPARCCPDKCGDGSTATCQRPPGPSCQSPLVPGHYEGCVACFDPKSCDRQCSSDADCASGSVCEPDPNDPCNTTAGCNRKGVSVCQAAAACTSDSQCPTGDVCVSGKCVPKPPPDPCAGAMLDASGQCVSPDGSLAPVQCCPVPPPSMCGDGSVQTCMLPANFSCPKPLIAVPYQHCVACVDPSTCDRQCSTSADCDSGSVCSPDPNDPCNQPATDCFAPGVQVCQSKQQCPPIACDIACPNGYATDPTTGCMTCFCNPTPCGCPDVLAPICGTDGQTYQNDCFAKCEGVGVASMGACTNKCGDGSVQVCDPTSNFSCPAPLVEATYKNCVACFDPTTCDRQCSSNSDCDPGATCQPDPNLPTCDPSGTAPCAPPVTVCVAQACPPVACQNMCPGGYAKDPATGCPTCQCMQGNCGCPTMSAPVCGTDGNTYTNACLAKCAGAGVASQGACGPVCTVTCSTPHPVCGADGNTYRCGEPDALCHNTTVASDGPCPAMCTVTCLTPDPVCGADGNTYECGEPDALCHNTTVASQGPCPMSCASTCQASNPVCGSDGKTYDCSAMAMCEGTGVAHSGACGAPCKMDSDCPSGDTCFRPDLGPQLPPTSAIGECQPYGFCESNYDCSSLPPPPTPCAGSWECLNSSCTWLCGPLP